MGDFHVFYFLEFSYTNKSGTIIRYAKAQFFFNISHMGFTKEQCVLSTTIKRDEEPPWPPYSVLGRDSAGNTARVCHGDQLSLLKQLNTSVLK
jgi:hypothetical protein